MTDNNRRALPKSYPTTVKTFVKMFLGVSATDISISDEKLGDLVVEHVKNNPEAFKLFNIVSYTFSPKVQEQLNFIDKQIDDIKSRQEKREAKHQEWLSTKYDRKDKEGNLIPPSERLKNEKEKREAKLISGADSDRRNIKTLTDSAHKLKEDEDERVRFAARENEKQAAERNKLIENLGKAQDKKEDEKEKRKRAKAKLVGGAIADAVSGVGEGFNLGRRIRGY